MITPSARESRPGPFQNVISRRPRLIPLHGPGKGTFCAPPNANRRLPVS
jgi:hypothetical protein